MVKVTNVFRKTPGKLQQARAMEACCGLAAVVAEDLCMAVRRTCVWLCMAAQVGEEMLEDGGFPVGCKELGERK